MTEITIRRARPADKPDWLRMRLTLWVEGTPEGFGAGIDELLADPEEQPVFIAVRPDGRPGGFLEGGLRKYAECAESSPVAYIEGWFVDEDLRRLGVGKLLVHAMEDWARERGLQEIGSDTWLENEVSIAAHLKLGYEEVERLVHFIKKL